MDSNPAETPIFELLEELVKFDGGSVVRKRLDIGDIQINASESELLFERKTFGDLCSSLGGRYGEQKSRIFAEQERRAIEGLPPMKVAFLIESRTVPLWSGAHATVKNANAYAALTKSALRDNMPSLWVSSAEDAAYLLTYTARALSNNGFSQDEKMQQVSRAGGYASFVHSTGKRKNRESCTFPIMLATIFGVSSTKAAAIADVYPTAAALVAAYNALMSNNATDKQLDTMLQDIVAGNKKLGPSTSKAIRKAFM